MKEGLLQGVNIRSDPQEIICLWWTPKIHNRVHKSPLCLYLNVVNSLLYSKRHTTLKDWSSVSQYDITLSRSCMLKMPSNGNVVLVPFADIFHWIVFYRIKTMMSVRVKHEGTKIKCFFTLILIASWIESNKISWWMDITNNSRSLWWYNKNIQWWLWRGVMMKRCREKKWRRETSRNVQWSQGKRSK